MQQIVREEVAAAFAVVHANTSLSGAVRRRFAVHMPGNEGTFSGLLTEEYSDYWVFEDCKTVPTHEGETVVPITGRVWIKHNVSPPPYLQELA